jgi:hypothetical protein
MSIDEGKGLNPYFEGLFDGESDELCALRLTLARERDEARADLETERMRLAACDVVAVANTPKSAARARDILPKHFSASLHSVMGAVDREMELRAEVERLRAAIEQHVAEEVARETERCADAARKWEDDYVMDDCAPEHVDVAIRARAEKETK